MQTSTSLPLWKMPIRIPNIHFWGSSRKIMTYFHLSACLWWAISIRHPAASGKNPEQCGEVGWNKYSSVFHFSQSSPKVTRLMVGQWSGHLQKTSWIWGFLGAFTTLSFKTSQELRMLSRSLSDCRSLLLNLNLSRCLCLCLCSGCSGCSGC